jgi:hypothetical protein
MSLVCATSISVADIGPIARLCRSRRTSLRVRPAELKLAAHEAGEPFGLLLGRAPDPARLIHERLDPDYQAVSLTFVSQNAFRAGRRPA